MKKTTKMFSIILAVVMVISLIPLTASAEKTESDDLTVYCVLGTGLPAKNTEIVLTNRLAENVTKTYTADSDGFVSIPKNLRGSYYVSATCEGPVDGLEWKSLDGLMWDMNMLSDVSCLRLFPVLDVEFEYIVHSTYMMGYGDGTFCPEQTLTRGEVVNLLYRLMTVDSREEYYSTENDYSDVKSGMAYNTAISTLANAGALDDFSDSNFGYKAVMTREQLAAILGRIFDVGYDGKNLFGDIDENPYADSINLLGLLGIFTPDEDGNFNPKAELTRGDICVILNKLLGRMPSADSIKGLHSTATLRTFYDVNEDSELYADIMEATNGHTYTVTAEIKDGKVLIQENWVSLRAPTNWVKLQK